MSTGPRNRVPPFVRDALAFALVAAVVYLSWPLRVLGTQVVDQTALEPTGVFGRVDLDLLMWILAWDAHALATAPAAIFQANILYPAPDVLAFSEHLLGLARTNGHSFLVELKYRIFRRGFSLHEVPIIFTQRRYGRTKMTRKENFVSLLNVWKLRG